MASGAGRSAPRHERWLATALALTLASARATAQPPAPDPDLVKGKEQALQGHYDESIATLSGVVRRLMADPARQREAADAYLHLGIAFSGLGQTSPATSQFVQALSRDPGIRPDPNATPPLALELFAQALKEALVAGTVPGGPKRKPEQKGGRVLIALGAAALAAGTVALAVGGPEETRRGVPPVLSNFVVGEVTRVGSSAIAVLPVAFDFADPDGDIVGIRLTTAACFFSCGGPERFPEARGRTSGHYEQLRTIPLPPVGPLTATLAVEDATSNRSNVLTAVTIRR